MIAENFRIEFNSIDLGQLLDGLESRAESWERTAEFLRTDEMPDGGSFIIEECSEDGEADAIAAHFRSIIAKITAQMEAQR